MSDYLDDVSRKIIQDSIEEKIRNKSTDFLDTNELSFLEKLNEKRLLNYIRNVPGVDGKSALELSEQLSQYRRGIIPQKMDDVQQALNALENWIKDATLDDYERRNIENIRQRISNYASGKGLSATEFDTEWANRYLAFHNKNYSNRVFDVAEDPSVEYSIPKNSLNIARNIYSSGAVLIDALCDMYKISRNELLAALVAENPQQNPDELTGEELTRKIALLAKGKRYAGIGSPASKAYSLYENYNARKVSPYGARASALLDYYNQYYTPGPMDILSSTIPSLLNKIDSLYMSDESPNNILLDENEIKALLDYYIDQYDQYKLDSKWLIELKSAIYPENEASKLFDIVITRSPPQMRNVGAAFIPQTGNGLAGKPQIVFYSSPKNSDFNSTAALAKLIHELAHAYQYYVLNEHFPNKDKNPKIEIFPYSKQFELEKTWNISNNPLIRNYFEEIDKTSEDEAERIYRKTKGLYERLGYNREKNYFLPDDI